MGTDEDNESTFVNQFLNEEGPLFKDRVKDWPDYLIESFCSILRQKLQNTGVSWVNPVVQLVPIHPESIFAQKVVRWQDEIRQSLYRPVAVNSTVQRDLDEAYEAIISPTSEENHLTPKLRKHSFSAIQCYQCIQNNSDDTITIYKCPAAQEGVAPTSTIINAHHYHRLFAISNPVWFLPSPVFSLSAAKSDLYEDYFVGTYLGLENGLGTCACATLNGNNQLRGALDWAIRLLFVRRLKDQNNHLLHMLEQYQKQMQMLRLLRIPLDRLSDALEKSQKDVQELRAIMYSPIRGLFAAARSIWPYFEEHRIVHAGGISWQVEHTVANYTNPFAVATTIAAIVCAVFGRGIEEVQSGALLYERMIDLLDRPSSAFKGLQRLCWVVLTHGHPDDKQTKSRVRKELADILRLEDEKRWSAFDGHKRILGYFKDILFTPYKVDDPSDKPLLPRWLALFSEGRPDIAIAATESEVTANT